MDTDANINGSVKPSKGNFLPFALILDTKILNLWMKTRKVHLWPIIFH